MTSLRNYDRLADRIRLHRQVDGRPVLVTEGYSDRRLVADLLPEGAAAMFVGGTRSEVLAVADFALKSQIDRIACLVDRDFDDAVSEAEQRGLPIVVYDGGDLEDMLLGSPAGERAINELASAPKLGAFGGALALIALVRERTAPLSRLRRANALGEWGLDFASLDLSAKVNRETLHVNVTSVCAALHRTAREGVDRQDLESCARHDSEGECPRTCRPLARGRDLLALIGVALRRLVGTRPKAQTTPELLSVVLRTAADREWLRATVWFQDLCGLAQFSDV